jgi:hypothetical protein
VHIDRIVKAKIVGNAYDWGDMGSSQERNKNETGRKRKRGGGEGRDLRSSKAGTRRCMGGEGKVEGRTGRWRGGGRERERIRKATRTRRQGDRPFSLPWFKLSFGSSWVTDTSGRQLQRCKYTFKD